MNTNTSARPYLPDPSTAPELFEGVLTRRVLAFIVDSVLISALVLVVGIAGSIAGFFTFGLGWLSLVILMPGAVVAYYAVTLGSHRRATVGMQMMDIVLTPTRGQPMEGLMAFLHALLFWATCWIAWPLVIIALFTPRRQMLHDMITGTMMVRRSPMLRHWQRVRENDHEEY